MGRLDIVGFFFSDLLHFAKGIGLIINILKTRYIIYARNMEVYQNVNFFVNAV